MSAEREQLEREFSAHALVQAIAVALFVAERTGSVAIIDLLFAVSRLASEHAKGVDEAR